MEYSKELNEINHLLAETLGAAFPDNIEVSQDEADTLHFRGYMKKSLESDQLGSYVSVALDEDVKATLQAVDPGTRRAMMTNLVAAIDGLFKAGYDKSPMGSSTRHLVATMAMVTGKQ